MAAIITKVSSAVHLGRQQLESGPVVEKSVLSSQTANIHHDRLGGLATGSLELMQRSGVTTMHKKLVNAHEVGAGLATQKHLAAALVQRTFRAYLLRKEHGAWYHKINLIYEVAILKERKRRRGLLVGFIQHLTYMILLAFAIQSGPSVSERYEVEGVMAETIAGSGVDELNTLSDYNTWLTSSFLQLFQGDDDNRGQGRIFINTYNEVLGSLRVEVMRVDSSICEWKVDGYRGEYRLKEATDACFGWLTPFSMANASFGPTHDSERYASTWKMDESRYMVDLGRDPGRVQKRVEELVSSGFINPLKTRTVRIRLLAYNDALAMFCALVVEATLSPTGVLETAFQTASFPVQEYMVHSMQTQVVVELILVSWTSAQLIKELVDVLGMLFATGTCLEYFQDPFNFLDAIRFALFFSAVAVRVLLLLDDSRNIRMDTTTFIDTEYVQSLYTAFDLISCYVTICTLLSTIQYFALTERTNMLKGTLAKTMVAMSTFVLVFLLFFLVYANTGMFLLGRSLESFRDFGSAVHTSFEMMNANIPFEDLLAASEQSLVGLLTTGFFYYSFLGIHWMLLLNVIIAIVCDAYMEVQMERNAMVAKTFRNNLGFLSDDLLKITWRRLYTLFLVVMSRLNPLSLLRRDDVFIEWDDDTWLEILDRVIDVRRQQGKPSRGTTLSALTREIKHRDEQDGIKFRTLAERIANTKLLPVSTTPSSDDVRTLPDTGLADDRTFRQVVNHFYRRAYWTNPQNLAEPFDDNAQPPQDTWADCTLEKLATTVNRLDRRAIATATTFLNTGDMLADMLDARDVKQ